MCYVSVCVVLCVCLKVNTSLHTDQCLVTCMHILGGGRDGGVGEGKEVISLYKTREYYLCIVVNSSYVVQNKLSIYANNESCIFYVYILIIHLMSAPPLVTPHSASRCDPCGVTCCNWWDKTISAGL